MRAVLVFMLLAGCAQITAPPDRPAPPQLAPEALQTCPPGIPAPKPPPPPRSIAGLLSWAISVDRAREETEAARAECSRRLNALNNWIVRQERR